MKGWYTAAIVALVAFGWGQSKPVQASDLERVLDTGKPILDVRGRIDYADDGAKPDRADANTVRLRMGYETGQWNGLSALAEFDQVWALGDDYNSTRNGELSYAVVPDPALTVLNRLQLKYSPLESLSLVLGRQRLTVSNQRVIGNSDWRQHEQTFDAVSISDSTFAGMLLNYAYVSQVNRPVGPADPLPNSGPASHFDCDCHFLSGEYEGVPNVRLGAYEILLDMSQKSGPPSARAAVEAWDTATAGVRAEIKQVLRDTLSAGLNVEYATQSNYGHNRAHFRLGYWVAEASLRSEALSLTGGYEVLQGNGTAAFVTPLASLHPFNGWADVFSTTPIFGLRDAHIGAGYTILSPGGFRSLSMTLVRHEFRTDRYSKYLGGEWNASSEFVVDQRLSILASYASYQGSTRTSVAPKDKSEFVLQARYKL